MNERRFTNDMAEISGLGGEYEECCRAMVLGGLRWIDANAGTDLKFSEMKNVYGIIRAAAEVSEQLCQAMADAAVAVVGPEGGPTGAMLHACMNDIIWIVTRSWDEYVRVRREQLREQQQAPKDGEQ